MKHKILYSSDTAAIGEAYPSWKKHWQETWRTYDRAERSRGRRKTSDRESRREIKELTINDDGNYHNDFMIKYDTNNEIDYTRVHPYNTQSWRIERKRVDKMS